MGDEIGRNIFIETKQGDLTLVVVKEGENEEESGYEQVR